MKMEANEASLKDTWTFENFKGTFQDIILYDNRYNVEAPHFIACGLRYGPGTEGIGEPVQYPDHDLSGKRYDITIDRVLALALVLFMITWLVQA